ncbi:hypothetical protein [Pseudohalioglobus lutimaris]|uniref:DUF2834 domain-containing protein n=1 Tax=Pseudohalioglobus lutimaris TaxID=1737061 RepID=A0A2N5X0D0_9GAMM|nr:hypothetical protein [Pseudohalioglobus lutimaris]PLW67947.1 hypothetical protein C0039_15035 [Pseudohalioglobus lutimaris]
MIEVRILLTVSTIAIYTLTVIAIVAHGWNWPLIAINDLLALNWRSQFDFDFIIHLLLLGSWVVWREGGNSRAYLFGFLSVVMGGMFSFPYIIYATFQASGKPRELLLGVHG